MAVLEMIRFLTHTQRAHLQRPNGGDLCAAHVAGGHTIAVAPVAATRTACPAARADHHVAGVLSAVLSGLVQPPANQCLRSAQPPIVRHTTQVHEKTILLVALPVAAYLPLDPLPCLLFLQTATFSLLPLLRQDGLLEAYAYIGALYLCALRIIIDCQLPVRQTADSHAVHRWWDALLLGRLFTPTGDRSLTAVVCGRLGLASHSDKTAPWRLTQMAVFYASVLLQATAFGVLAYVEPPPQLPHLFPLLIAAISAAYFCGFFVYWTAKLWLCDVEDEKRHTE